MKRFAVILVALALLASACSSDQTTTETYTITVNYDFSIEEAVEAGHYEIANLHLTSQNFPSSRSGTDTVSAHLVRFEEFMTSDEVLQELDKQNLRPASIEELLAFGATYPELQRQFLIIALGSVVLDSYGGYQFVPALWGYERNKRVASLVWIDTRWYAIFRFLAIRK